LNGGAETAFEQHRAPHPRKSPQEGEVLHVARAYLKDVHLLEHQGNLRDLHHFGDHWQTVLAAGFAEDPDSRLAHSLERIGTGARLVRSPSKQLRPSSSNGRGRHFHLLDTFDRAGAGNHHKVRTANFDPADIDPRRLRAAGAKDFRREIVLLAATQRLLHSRLVGRLAAQSAFPTFTEFKKV
jgi:hypothetical protein